MIQRMWAPVIAIVVALILGGWTLAGTPGPKPGQIGKRVPAKANVVRRAPKVVQKTAIRAEAKPSVKVKTKVQAKATTQTVKTAVTTGSNCRPRRCFSLCDILRRIVNPCCNPDPCCCARPPEADTPSSGDMPSCGGGG